MSLDGTYETSNVLARILRDELPSAWVFEDDHTLAFLDAAPPRNILEVEPDALCQVMATVQRTAAALRRALSPDGIHVAQFNGGDTGQSVFHLHVHVVPRWKGRKLGILQYYEPDGLADQGEQASLAQRIAASF